MLATQAGYPPLTDYREGRMRTIYACKLEFESDQTSGLWSEVVGWWQWAFQRAAGRSIDFDPNGDVTREGELRAGSRTRLHIWRHADALLREIDWFAPDQYDPTLSWQTSVKLLERSQGVTLEVVLSMSGIEFNVLPAMFNVFTPAIVRTLVTSRRGRLHGIELGAYPRIIGHGEVPGFADLLFNQDRRIPVIAISPDRETGRPIVDGDKLARELSGLAIIAILKSDATFPLTDAVGKALGCFGGAVRIYWPSLKRDPTQDDESPTIHPLYMPWDITERQTPERFASFLVRKVFGIASYRYSESAEIRAVRSGAQRAESQQLAKDGDYEKLFESWSAKDDETRKLQTEIDVLRTENLNLLANQNALFQYDEDSEAEGDEAADLIESGEAEKSFLNVAEAVEAAKANFPHLYFLPDAQKSAKASPFRRPGKVYTCLSVLAEISEKWAEEGSGFSWASAFKTAGFHLSEHQSMTSLGKWGTEYEHVYEGEKRLFELHVTIGGGNPAGCISIHFLRDTNKKRVVIGWVGRHKTNTKS
jgi:hypothetical protein